jgi:hypothetical protein
MWVQHSARSCRQRTAAGSQSDPSIAWLRGGGTVVVGAPRQDGDAGGIFGQVYSPTGTKIGT